MWRYSVFLLPVTNADKIYKSSLFVELLGVILLPKPKLSSEQKAENVFVAPPYCQCNVKSNIVESLWLQAVFIMSYSWYLSVLLSFFVVAKFFLQFRFVQ